VLATELQKMFNFDLRESWQVKMLLATENLERAVVLSILAHNYDEQMPYVLTVAFNWYMGPSTEMPLPCLTSAARIAKTGAVVADVMGRDGVKHREKPLFKSEIHLRDAFRKIADQLKLPDDDRVEMFRCVQRWVVADRRLDPNFDPRDPDAKRLTIN
jgi:hypothetical protein